MAGRHRTARRRAPRPVELVDVRGGTTHLLTRDAYTAGFDPHTPYVALCGAEVLPASLTDPGRRYCQSCRTSVPAQQSAGA